MKIEEILEAVRVLQEATPHDEGIQNWVRNYFPELKEPDDEKIRKRLIAMCKHYIECYALDPYNIDDYKEALAWLEKQNGQKPVIEIKTPEESLGIDSDIYNKIVDECIYGEQKPADKSEPTDYNSIDPHFAKPIDKVEPKFEIGDWVVRGRTIAQILDIQEQYYVGLDIDGNDFTSSRFLSDDKIHLWTIQEAKEGDVLVSPATQEGDKECPFIFKEIDKNGIVRFYAALLQSEELKIADRITNVMGYANAGYHIPATKEQRDTLFAKMKDTGYEWDAEKKELKKIEQKPAWSEEDEDMCYKAIAVINRLCAEGKDYVWSIKTLEKLFYWLKSLKDRVGCEVNCTTTKEWKPSDEQMNNK